MNDLSGKKIVITGGAGFLGSHIVNELLKEDIKQLIIYDNLAYGNTSNLENAFEDERVTLVKRDIADFLILDYLLYESDYVFHFAKVDNNICVESPETGLVTNVIGTFNLLRTCVKNNVKKVIFPSSIYTDRDKTFYAAGKSFSEKILEFFYENHGLNYSILRYADLYGREEINKNIVNVVIEKVKNNVPFIIDDRFYRLNYVNDVAKLCIEILKKEEKNCVYHAVPEKVLLSNIINKILKISGKNINVKYDKVKDNDEYFDNIITEYNAIDFKYTSLSEEMLKYLYDENLKKKE